MSLDLEIFQQEIRRVSVVGVDTSYLCSSEHHNSGLVFAEPLLHRQRIKQIEPSDLVSTADGNQHISARLIALPAIPCAEDRKTIARVINVIPVPPYKSPSASDKPPSSLPLHRQPPSQPRFLKGSSSPPQLFLGFTRITKEGSTSAGRK